MRATTGGRTESVEAGLRAAMSELVASNLSRPNLLRLYSVLSSEASAPDHPAHEWFVIRYRRITEGLATAIRHDQSRGRICSSLDPIKAAQLLLGAWDGLQLQWLLDPNEDMVAQIQLMMAGLFGEDPSSSQVLKAPIEDPLSTADARDRTESLS